MCARGMLDWCCFIVDVVGVVVADCIVIGIVGSNL